MTRDFSYLLNISQRPLSLDYQYEGGEDGEDGPFLGLQVQEQDQFDRVGWTNLFHLIPQKQLEIMICLFLGLSPKEIVTVLDFKNIAQYYNISNKLRKSYRLKKAQFVD